MFKMLDPQAALVLFLKSYLGMDFFSCPCLLSEPADWIKGIGFPQTLCVINISAEQMQMQNTANPPRDLKTFSVSFFYVFKTIRIIYTAKKNTNKSYPGLFFALFCLFFFDNRKTADL